MSLCTRCGASFSCAMVDNGTDSTDSTGSACWCTTLPAAVAVPTEAAGCWCRACLEAHIAALLRPNGNAQNP